MNGGAYTPGELFFQAGWCLSRPTLVEIPTKSQGFSSCCFRWGDPIRTWVPRPAQISVWSVLWPQLSDESKWVLHVQFLFVFPASFGIQPLYTTETKCVYQAHCLAHVFTAPWKEILQHRLWVTKGTWGSKPPTAALLWVPEWEIPFLWYLKYKGSSKRNRFCYGFCSHLAVLTFFFLSDLPLC